MTTTKGVGKDRSDKMNKIGALVEEIEATLKQERQSYADGAESDENIKGWIEALQYVLRQIEVIVE